jgi:hypothetical protein
MWRSTVVDLDLTLRLENNGYIDTIHNVNFKCHQDASAAHLSRLTNNHVKLNLAILYAEILSLREQKHNLASDGIICIIK